LLAAALHLYAVTCPSRPPGSTFIYVATTGSDSGTCGSSETSPCQTLQQAVNRCNGANCIVVVRHGIYSVSTPVTISAQIQLYGSCSFTGESPNRYRTIVRGLPAFSIAPNGASVKLAGFTILANDATAGNASIAMVVDAAILSLDQTVVVSGAGGAGSPGANAAGGKGGNAGSPATVVNGPGGPGGPGVACADPGHEMSGYGGGGAQVQVVDSTGGLTHTTCTLANSSIAQKGGDAGTATGGSGGGNGSAGCDCVGGSTGDTPDGHQGGPGAPGAPSAAGGTASTNLVGQFRGLTWAPATAGGAGNWGLPGAGGGGGGSGGFAAVEIDFHHNDYEGQPGGGGGSGGCGGLGGGGGTPGGASFPVVFHLSVLRNSGSNVIIPGPGGPGGHGGKGGDGAAGGGGGGGLGGHQTHIDGWFGSCHGSAPGSGGSGNSGGTGGAGSGGAGGNGGPSFALVQVSPLSLGPTPSWTYYEAQPGPGGPPGDGGGGNGPATPAKAGLPGGSGQTHTYAAVGTGERPPKGHKQPPPKHHQPQRNHEHEREE
jgi:hypothetical protein